MPHAKSGSEVLQRVKVSTKRNDVKDARHKIQIARTHKKMGGTK